jgi:superfamily II DNA or RNA helicase
MAIKLDPVRLLIADDVGIGKTVEAALVVRELLDRGEVQRCAILCPPHLAEQWQRELRDKFHLEAETVLSSTIARLERTHRIGATESIFQKLQVAIVSTDYIKQPSHRDEFIRDCPELVVVDEAHACTVAGQPGKARQQRFDLLRKLAANKSRHVILVTATPHSGNEEAFRSLLSLLDEQFADLPNDLDRAERETIRRELAKHLVQRRRRDIKDYLGAETSFPDRETAEDTYSLSPEYKVLFQKALRFASELVADESGNKRQRRVRWWSALSLLRALASSPAAAAATLKARAVTAESVDEAEADEMGRRAVLDQDESDTIEPIDITPGSDASQESADRTVRDRLRAYAREAEALFGKKDAKVQKAAKLLGDMIEKGHSPIVFCRFIDTAEYVAQHLRDVLKDTEILAVTGLLPPKEREDRIEELAERGKQGKRIVLVCTDCLSEGVNLQEHFDAVVHYDLSWNPTRHEQREGRVDRFGQPRPVVKVLTYFGIDNRIDGIVLDVLLRKHQKIKSDLGISVAVPGNSEQVIEALFEGMLLRGEAAGTTEQLVLGDWLQPQKEDLHKRWDDATEREKRSRSRFAQHTISTEEVANELLAVREAIGGEDTVKAFFRDALHLVGVPLTEKRGDRVHVAISNETPRSLRNAISRDDEFVGRFTLPIQKQELYLARTSPIVEGLASWVLDQAIDPVVSQGQRIVARRCGVSRIRAVTERTALLLVRFRYHLITIAKGRPDRTMLVEEIRSLGFTGSPAAPTWISDEQIEPLLHAPPAGNVLPSLIKQQLETLIQKLPQLTPHLNAAATSRADRVLQGHTRVREDAQAKGKIRVEVVLPTDLLGCFILLPND